MKHLSSVWSDFASWFATREGLRRQLREAKSTIREQSAALTQLTADNNVACKMFDSSTRADREGLQAAEDLLIERDHTIRLLDSKIEVLSSEIDLLGGIVERDIERVKKEKAGHSFRAARMLDGGEVPDDE